MKRRITTAAGPRRKQSAVPSQGDRRLALRLGTTGRPPTVGRTPYRTSDVPGATGARRRSLTGVDEPVLEREQGGARPGGQARLAVQPLDVMVTGLRGDPQLAGHLLGGHPAGDEAEHLALALGQPGRPRLRYLRAGGGPPRPGRPPPRPPERGPPPLPPQPRGPRPPRPGFTVR